MKFLVNSRAAGRVGLVVAAVSLLATGALAGDKATVPAAQWKQAVRIFNEAVKQDQIVGASLALVEGGLLSKQNDYGFADSASEQRVDGDTIFQWGSITKTLTAITVMQLRDRGKLSLDEPVTRYLPELRKVHNPYGSMDAVTIRMLLDHSAGFQFATWPYKKNKPWEPFEPTTWEQLVAMMPYEEVAFPPGSRYGYSNPAFIYLARIVEIVTGDSWQTYVAKNVFAPLGMTRSYFNVTPYYLQAARSNNYYVRRKDDGAVETVVNGREFDPGITNPNGGWNAPVADVVTYIAFLTGAAHGDVALQRRFDVVLRRSTLEEMWQPHFPAPTNVAAAYMGLSFFTIGSGTQRIIGHTGSQAGFTAFIYFNPAKARGVIAVFNTMNQTHAKGEPNSFNTIQAQALEVLQ